MLLNVERLNLPPLNNRQAEMVERKGKGHPDTVCDRASEELSINLSKFYLEQFGRILHHNVDKCILAGGSSDVGFGTGIVTKPIYILLVGRATSEAGGIKVPVEELAVEGTRKWIKETFRFLDPGKEIRIESMIRPGSVDLVAAFEEGKGTPLANDTSIGVSFFPLTETEAIVREAERFLNSPEIKKTHPYIGEDIKVMGVRVKDEIRVTVACAFISHLVPSMADYLDMKGKVALMVRELASGMTGRKISVDVNTADIVEKGAVYITATGTSAESGDDGQVGRGNRVGGLITPYRPMTLEATAGKNPVNHVGKLYNIAARNITERIAAVDGIDEACCYLVSQIGRPVNDPQSVDVRLVSQLDEAETRRMVAEIVEAELKELPFLWKRIINREFELF